MNASAFLSLSVVLVLAAAAGAQEYSSTVLLKGLSKPTGILVEPNGDVVFSQIPKRGSFDKTNMVSRYVAKTSKVALIVAGEPAPVNFGRTSKGDLYWTCVTAGVIVRKLTTGSGVAVFKSGLSSPNGITISSKDTIYLTQIPTPGKTGSASKNTVDFLSGTTVKNLSTGEPEPFDVVADSSENLYWTCRTAGVILRRDAKTGTKTKVLTGLKMPQGLAIDSAGNLYFTEVPTPGKNASNGGKNAIWRYSPATKNLTLIEYGDPEPTDVTVSADGKNVYWTCTSAGVIKHAVRNGRVGTVTTSSTTKLGDKVKMTFLASMDKGASFVAASSADVGPLAIGNRYIALALDPIFSATFLVNGLATGYFGKLDATTGSATGTLSIPNIAAAKGLTIHTAFVTQDGTAPLGVGTISSSLRFVIE